jgi:hypothetical protein
MIGCLDFNHPSSFSVQGLSPPLHEQNTPRLNRCFLV